MPREPPGCVEYLWGGGKRDLGLRWFYPLSEGIQVVFSAPKGLESIYQKSFFSDNLYPLSSPQNSETSIWEAGLEHRATISTAQTTRCQAGSSLDILCIRRSVPQYYDTLCSAQTSYTQSSFIPMPTDLPSYWILLGDMGTLTSSVCS